MKVNKRSWHYRLTDFIWQDTHIPDTGNNLCKYFWMVVWSVVLSSLIPIIVSGLGILFYFDTNICDKIAVFITVLYVISGLSLPVIAVWAFRAKFGERIEITTPLIVEEFIMAKKNKVCPMIDFE